MKALDQIISSAGVSSTGTSKTQSAVALANHSSSTGATPLPEP